ncbi:MAG: glycoside hydrolase family 3 N-terminal domain-containing protein, partial [Pseudomonadota bacterium]
MERSLVTLANMTGRSRDKSKINVPKHFPGGPPETELTELGEFPDNTPAEQFKGLIPFRYLTSSNLMQAVMVGHSSYPNLERAFSQKYYDQYEKPMVAELQKIIDETEYRELTKVRPATFSPIIIRGILREEVGFNGYVLPDSLGMGSVRKYVEKFKQTEETKRIPTSALTVILAVYAGIDSVFGLSQEYIEDAYDYVTEYRRN